MTLVHWDPAARLCWQLALWSWDASWLAWAGCCVPFPGTYGVHLLPLPLHSFPVALSAHSHLECFFLTPSISGVRKIFQISPSSLHPSWQNYLLIAFLEPLCPNSPSILQHWETESCTLVPWKPALQDHSLKANHFTVTSGSQRE